MRREPVFTVNWVKWFTVGSTGMNWLSITFRTSSTGTFGMRWG